MFFTAHKLVSYFTAQNVMSHCDIRQAKQRAFDEKIFEKPYGTWKKRNL